MNWTRNGLARAGLGLALCLWVGTPTLADESAAKVAASDLYAGTLAAGDTELSAILARDPDGRLLFVRQWRVPADRALLEVPAGTLDVHDGVIEDPDLAARRELEEETGYRATTWQKLAEFWTAPGFASELMHLYLADGLTAADADRLGPDEDEHLELERLTLSDALAKVDDGSIADAKSIVGLLWLDRMERRR